MTPEEARELVKRIMLEYSLAPEIEDELKKLVDSIGEGVTDTSETDERIAILEKELAESKQKYIDRFFNGDTEEVEEQGEEIKEEQEEDVERDGEVQTFDELFKEREG